VLAPGPIPSTGSPAPGSANWLSVASTSSSMRRLESICLSSACSCPSSPDRSSTSPSSSPCSFLRSSESTPPRPGTSILA
jgi:hypothetical protein